MGANLSSTLVPDTSKVVLSPTDRNADITLAVIWVLVLYGFAIIFSTCALVDRWKGPTDKIRVGGRSGDRVMAHVPDGLE
ncbi:hypothetical protein TOPH_08350 [Tolypocladium ophioglossoides CBS 100239]|uniref:Uncharacterized protein n=1 Tax=Tolypocladium ophioglossoides (strain CBS 100239) TaxID=1163406 RepID=A0A0L0MYM2_TOLOC|nr:hypothetical protein TOPH_08350 [Tolypocladium ophioglossoides CBS 100239]